MRVAQIKRIHRWSRIVLLKIDFFFVLGETPGLVCVLGAIRKPCDRSVVLGEFVELRACVYEKIEGRYNVADGSTKPIPHATWLAHRSYSHPYANVSNPARSVVAAAFHVQPLASGAQAQFDIAYSALTESDCSSVDRLFMLMEGG